MSASSASCRPLSCLKLALRQCRAERQRMRHRNDQQRTLSTATESYPSLQTRWPKPAPGFRTSHATKQNRPDSPNLKRIPVVPPPRSLAKLHPDPISNVTQDQLKVLDPTGARARLFNETNIDAAKVGDILLVRLKSGDPFAGVCLEIRKRNSPIDTSILLRNQLTRVGVEMWFKIYSPSVEGIEVVQRKQGKRVRRAKLYYMRKPEHDLGSVEGMVKQYQRQRAGGPIGGRADGKQGGQRGSKHAKKKH
nr:54s ribosomal protein subunit img1, mitochondrial [Quercus suber]